MSSVEILQRFHFEFANKQYANSSDPKSPPELGGFAPVDTYFLPGYTLGF